MPDDTVMSDGADEPRRGSSLWHAAEAEKLLRIAGDLSTSVDHHDFTGAPDERDRRVRLAVEYRQQAQVHASLAQAAATRENADVVAAWVRWLQGGAS